MFLIDECSLPAADAWFIVKPHSRSDRDSAGAQGRLLKSRRLKQQPPYACRDGYELCKALSIFVLIELQKLKRDNPKHVARVHKTDVEINQYLDAGNLARACWTASPACHPGDRKPFYNPTLEKIRRGLDLALLENLHGMTRADAWRALCPKSNAVGDSAAAVARRAIRKYKDLEAQALELLREPESPPEVPLPSWIAPSNPPDLVWYARLVAEPQALQQQIEQRLTREEATGVLPPVSPGRSALPKTHTARRHTAQVAKPPVAKPQKPSPRRQEKWNPYKVAEQNRRPRRNPEYLTG